MNLARSGTAFTSALKAMALMASVALAPTALADHEKDRQWHKHQWNDDHVLLFRDCGFSGQVKSVPIGDYENTDKIGIERNQISAIIVPDGLAVEVFQKKGFRGHWYRINQNQACLKGNWNDRIAAIRVVPDDTRNSYGYSDNIGKGGKKRKQCHPYTLRAYDGNGAIRFVDNENQLNQFPAGKEIRGEICDKGPVRVELAKKDRRVDILMEVGGKDYLFERWSQYDDYRNGWYRKFVSIDLPKNAKSKKGDDQKYGANGWGNTPGFGKRYSSGVPNGANWGNNYPKKWNHQGQVAHQQASQQQAPVKPKPTQPAKRCTTYTATANHPETGMRWLIGSQDFFFIGNGTVTKEICHSGQVQIEINKRRPPAQVVVTVNGRNYVFAANDKGDRFLRTWYRKYHTINLP